MCHPPMMEFCERCGQWAGPSGPTPEELEAYQRTLLTFEEVADALNVDESTLRWWVWNRVIPTAQYAPGYFNPQMIARWVREKARTAGTAEEIEAYQRTLLTFEEVADLLNVDEYILQWWVWNGFIPTAPYAYSGPNLPPYFDAKVIVKWIRERASKGGLAHLASGQILSKRKKRA
jgi:hypothetical protein